jgi:hypothetical protein
MSTTLPSPFVNPSSYGGNMFDSNIDVKMTTGGKTGVLSGGGGGIYHGFDGNAGGYDLSPYQNNYVPQTASNHAEQRIHPYSGGGGRRKTRTRRRRGKHVVGVASRKRMRRRQRRQTQRTQRTPLKR